MIEETTSGLVDQKENLPREANKTTDSKFDRIYKYYHNDRTRIELTKDEEQTASRWEKAWLLLCRHRTRNQVAQLLMKLFNVGRSTAYDDIRHSMALFSDPREDMTPAKRAIAEDAFLKGADKAWKKGNLELHLKYMDKYAEINGLKEHGAESDEMAKMLRAFKPAQIIMNFKAEDLRQEAERMRESFRHIMDIPHEPA